MTLMDKMKSSYFPSPPQEGTGLAGSISSLTCAGKPKDATSTLQQDGASGSESPLFEIAMQLLNELNELKNKRSIDQEQVRISFTQAIENFDRTQYLNPLKSLLDLIEQNTHLRGLSNDIASDLLLSARRLLKPEGGKDSEIPATRSTKQKYKHQDSEFSSLKAPVVVAAAVPFGKKPQNIPSYYDMHKTPQSISQGQQKAAATQAYHRDDHSQFRPQSLMSGYKGQARTYHTNKITPDSRPDFSQYSWSGSPVDDDVQGKLYLRSPLRL